jgi:myosin heavy subunit
MSGDSYPFFVGEVLTVDEEHESVRLKVNTQKSPCNEERYMQDAFDIKKNLIMEYSDCAETGIPDMMHMDELNHATLLINMKKRYNKDQIFTFVGPTLLIINPFKKISGLYGDEIIDEYMSIITCDNMIERKKELEPHIYSVAATAFRQLKENKEKQAIVVSGESGAGKTEGAKIAMKFLTALSTLGNKGEEKKLPEGEVSIEQKILNCNPVLEAFGNAKTVRNNNSSRFGKYVKLVFDLKKGGILGAETLNYLLEKSRVCKQSSEERNYHIFYHLLKGATVEKLKELKLTYTNFRPEYTDFKFLKYGTDIVDPEILDDKELFDELIQVFNDLGFEKEEQDAVWRTVAA